jgi:hypothetical protein
MDHTSYPHLIQLVLAYADRGVRIAFRATSREYRSKILVDQHLVLTHIASSQEPQLLEYPSEPLPVHLQPSINHDRWDIQRHYEIRRVCPEVLDVRDSCVKLNVQLPRTRLRSCSPTLFAFRPHTVRYIPGSADCPSQLSQQCFLVQSLAPTTLVVFTSPRAEQGWVNHCAGNIQKLVLNVDMDRHIQWPRLDWGLGWGSIDFLEVESFVIIFSPPSSGHMAAEDLDKCLNQMIGHVGTTGTWFNDTTGVGQAVLFVGLEALTDNVDAAIDTLRKMIYRTACFQVLLYDEDLNNDITQYTYGDRIGFMSREEYAFTLSPEEWKLQTVM